MCACRYGAPLPRRAYNLSSNRLEELGGSEKKRIKESLYPNDLYATASTARAKDSARCARAACRVSWRSEWSGKGRIALAMPPQRITLELWPETSPLAVENFVSIVMGCRGKGAESGCALSYVGCHFHRVVSGFVAQVRPPSGGVPIAQRRRPARRALPFHNAVPLTSVSFLLCAGRRLCKE